MSSLITAGRCSWRQQCGQPQPGPAPAPAPSACRGRAGRAAAACAGGGTATGWTAGCAGPPRRRISSQVFRSPPPSDRAASGQSRVERPAGGDPGRRRPGGPDSPWPVWPTGGPGPSGSRPAAAANPPPRRARRAVAEARACARPVDLLAISPRSSASITSALSATSVIRSAIQPGRIPPSVADAAQQEGRWVARIRSPRSVTLGDTVHQPRNAGAAAGQGRDFVDHVAAGAGTVAGWREARSV